MADILSMQDCFRRSRHKLRAFVLLIVGTSELPQAMHGSLHNASSALELQFRIRPEDAPVSRPTSNDLHGMESDKLT